MPKIKSHSGTKKRMKRSGSGKIVFRKPSGNHFLQKKSASRKRGFRGVQTLHAADVKRVSKKIAK